MLHTFDLNTILHTPEYYADGCQGGSEKREKNGFDLDVQLKQLELLFVIIIIIIIINDTLARSLEPVVTECKEHTIHTQTQVVASRKPK